MKKLGVLLVLAAGFALAALPAAARPAPPATVQEILTTDPLLLSFEQVTALAAQREQALAAGSTPEDAQTLLDAGALEWQLAQAAANSADGGLGYICRSFRSLRRSTQIFSKAGGDFEVSLLEARLRYADVLAFGFCEGGPDCAVLSDQALSLVQKALATAKARRSPALTAQALRGLAEVQRGLAQRPGNAVYLSGQIYALLARDCPLCTITSPRSLALDPGAPEETPPDTRRALLEEAVRIEAAGGLWTRGLVESLVPLSLLHWRAGREGLASALAAAAANGSAALALPARDTLIADIARIHLSLDRGLGPLPFDARMIGGKISDLVRAGPVRTGMGYVLLSRLVATAGDARAEQFLADFRAQQTPAHAPIAAKDLQAMSRTAPAPEKPLDCDPGRLRQEAAGHLRNEIRLLTAALPGQDEKTFRWLMSALPAEDRIFREIRSCKAQDQDLLRTAVARLLLRRDAWQYRLNLLNAARASSGTAARIAELADLRRQAAEQRLRTVDTPAATELRWAVCKDDWPRESALHAVIDTDTKIAQLEQELLAQADRGAPAITPEGLWSGLLAGLGQGTALVGYVPVAADPGRHLLALVIDSSGRINWADAGLEADIAVHAKSVSAGLVRDVLRPAGQALFDPIEKSLNGTKKVLLLAAGPVRLLPWSALQDRNGRPLGSRFTVSWLQGSADARPDAASPAPAAPVALVAPQYEPARPADNPWPRIVAPGFPPLPEAAREVDAVAQRLAAHHIPTAILKGPAATESAVRKIAGPAVLHLAAHGFHIEIPELPGEDYETRRAAWFRYGVPFLPEAQRSDLGPAFTRVGVALAGANRLGPPEQGDGLLTAGEAADLDLRGTRLVVLSGCATGFPALQDAGGAYDLAIGFRRAGAQSVIASLWKVEDRASRLLMEELYKGLLDGLPVADALWRAKDVLRKTPGFSDPKSWAPFEVFGANLPVWPRGGARPPRARI